MSTPALNRFSPPDLPVATRHWESYPALTPALAGRLAVLALALMGLLMSVASDQESVTFDEVVHLPSGISYWQTRDARLNLEHPLFGKLLAALPAAMLGIQPDYHSAHWTQPFGDLGGAGQAWGDDFMRTDPRADSALHAARGVMVLVTLGLGWVLFALAGRLWGPAAGLFTVILYAGDPFFLGYGPLVITDIILPFFALLSVWSYCTWLEVPRPGPRTVAALTLVAALTSKYSAILLGPLLFFLWMAQHRRLQEGTPPASGAECTRLSVVTVTIWAAFQMYFAWFTPPQVLGVNGLHHAAVARLTSPLVNWMIGHPRLAHGLVPLLLYPRGLLAVAAHANRPTVLLGRLYPDGTAWYFPAVFVLKTPPLLVALLLLLGAAWFHQGLRAVMRPAQCRRLHVLGLAGLAFLFLAAALASHLDIGIRHLSVPLTLAVLVTGAAVPVLERLGGVGWVRAGLVAAALCSATTAWQTFPDFIPYRSTLAGPSPFYQQTGDSNIDWGQGLRELQAMHDRQASATLWLDAFGGVPAHDVPGAVPWTCDQARARPLGWVAVSASRLNQELSFARDRCAWLFAFAHREVGHGAIELFDLRGPGPDPTNARVRWERFPDR